MSLVRSVAVQAKISWSRLNRLRTAVSKISERAGRRPNILG